MHPLILVVEDEDDNLSAICSVLTREGYRVLAVQTGPAALVAARTKSPDAVLLDLAIPGMNGLDVAQLLNRDPRTASIPIVALSGSWLAEDRTRLAELGFAAALRKPFRAETLLAELRRVLAGMGALQNPVATGNG